MNTLPTPETTESPITKERIAPFIHDMTQSGQRMISDMSKTLNDIQFQRAMQLGYLMACQDFGLPTPEFDDPAENTVFGN